MPLINSFLLYNIPTVTLQIHWKLNDTEKTTNCRVNVYRTTEILEQGNEPK